MNRTRELLAESLEVDVGEISSDLNFRDHENWDSLAALSLITAIEDEFGVVLSDTDLRQLVTVQELTDLLSSRSTQPKR